MCAFCLAAPLADAREHQAYIPDALLKAATADPAASFKVIVQGAAATATDDVAADVRGEGAADPGKAKGLGRKFASISGVSAELTGKQILKLAKKTSILAITQDASMVLADIADPPASVSPPTISGTAQEGQALTAATGDWTGLGPLAYSYQWQRCGPAGRAAAALATAPVGYWRLGETAGVTAADSSGHGLGGTYVGGVTPGAAGATGAADTAVKLDGSTGYVDVPGVASTSFASSFTLEAWVKPTAAQTDRGIVGRWTYPWGGMLLWIDGAGNYGLAITADSANYLTTSVAPVVGTWQHVVGTWDGTMLRLYVDGTAIGSRPFAGSPGLPLDNLQIGNYRGPDKYLNGAVDEVALYDRALTAREIRTQYLGCENLVGATSPAYAPAKDDVASTVRVVVTATNAAASSSAVSESTAPVVAAPIAPPPPANTDLPTIAGTLRDGETLTATSGTWTGAPAGYSYQWRQCNADGNACTDIAGAVAASYTLTPTEVRSTVRVVVTATGAPSTAVSLPSGFVWPAPPANRSPPTLSAPTEGVTVAAAPGTWSGTAPIAYSYEWELCDAGCTAIVGATQPTYTPIAADVGRTLKVIVRGTNSGGYASATSAVSAPVEVGSGYSSAQLWPYASSVAAFWPKASSHEVQTPAIAIIDSGIDASRADFGGRVVQQVTLTTLTPNSPGDGRGHGTFVASVAAGQAHGHTGAAPDANIVSLDVMDDNGLATTSDVIAAADWILQNKNAYNIRVANFSLTGSVASSFQYDPLDKAVEKLWLNGVVVVTAAGNYANAGLESGVRYAPSNDPFVITVGAEDLVGTLAPADDTIAPWSAFGYTPDGFAKPDISAPGRYIVGAVSAGSTLALERPAQIVEPGYMQLSGTSFSAPIVAGTAAELLGAHPTWTPDQVKGALMLSAYPLPLAAPRSSGVGAEDAAKALSVVDPPDPNLGLAPFIVPDPSGSGPVFDAAAWGQAVAADPAWSQAAWGQAAWGQAAWGQAAWGQAYWSSAAWGQGAGGTSLAPSAASSDVLGAGGYWITSTELAKAQDALGLG